MYAENPVLPVRGGGGVASTKYEAKDQTLYMLHTWQSDLNKVSENERREKKVKVTQGRTPTHDLGNGLPYPNQLSYRVTTLQTNDCDLLGTDK